MSYQRKGKKIEVGEMDSKADVEVAPKKAFDESHPMAAKAEAIMASAMPEDQKQRYLREIGVVQSSSDTGKVPFNVYAKIRKVAKDRLKAMEVYPKAASVRSATIEEWDEIFKAF